MGILSENELGSSQIVVEDVHRVFKMGDVEVHALNGVNLEIKKSEFVLILGPSGSGKTTLLNLIGGIDQPTRGSVMVDGRKLNELSRSELTEYRRSKVGWIFQFFNLIPSLTALENVALALELAEDKENMEERAIKALEQVDLRDKVERFPSQLSGGEQQRVAIARALVKNPSIVVADEPTGNIDSITGKKVVDLMVDLNKGEGITFVVVSHDVNLGRVADVVYHLRDGRIIEVEDHVVEKLVKRKVEV